MVFAASGIVGTFHRAVDDVFSHVMSINGQSIEEIRIFDESIFGLPNDDPVVKAMKPLVKPKRGETVGRDSAYGIFIGYTLGLGKDNRSPAEYRNLVEPKMASDIKHYAPYIRRKIEDCGLTGNSFYMYFFPLDNAEADKLSVMKKVLRED